MDIKLSSKNLLQLIPIWTWSEIAFGLEEKILTEKDIMAYAKQILEDNMEQYELVMELAIADEEEVGNLLLKLVCNSEKEEEDTIRSKWMFAIIYNNYIYDKKDIHKFIDNVYSEFNYPDEIENLIPYMPCDAGSTIDERLENYICMGKRLYCNEKKEYKGDMW